MKTIYTILSMLPISYAYATADIDDSSHAIESHKTSHMNIVKKNLSSINFDDFSGDPYELEDRYLTLAKSKKFREAAIALIGSGLSGNSENLDYVLKINHEAIAHVRKKDLKNTEILIEQVARKLAE